MFEETHPILNLGMRYGLPAWNIGELDSDYRSGIVATCWAISGDDIALYRAGVARA